nr:hypothetical protein [Streptomyces sp. RPT161]
MQEPAEGATEPERSSDTAARPPEPSPDTAARPPERSSDTAARPPELSPDTAPRPFADADPEPSVQPLGVTVEPTGNAEVDALLERLADADDLPTEGHIEVYEDVHRGLRDTLTALDSRPGPPGPNQRHEDRS